MAKFFCFLVVFLFIYPISLNVLPIVSTRIVMAFLGVVWFVYYLAGKLNNRNLSINRGLFYVVISLIVISSISVISIIYNKTSDLEFVVYPFPILITFSGAYFIVKTFENLDVSSLMSIIILTTALQSIISFILFLSPEIQDFIYSIVYLPELKATKVEKLSESQIIGFSKTFFSAGIYSGMSLLFIAYSIRYRDLKSRELYFFTFLYVLIFAVGMMMARTTLVGALLGLLLIFMPNRMNSVSLKKTKFLFFLLSIPIVFIFVISILFPNILSKIQVLIEFGFELFINYNDTGELRTTSTDGLMRMFVLADSTKTWIIGDGLWSDPYSLGYYKHIDVGYLRLVYYFGILGTLSYFISQFIMLKQAFNKNLPIFIFFLYVLILNVKGFADLNAFFGLFLVLQIHLKSKELNNSLKF